MPPIIIDLIWIVAAVLIVGVFIWGLDQIPAIDSTFKTIARVILIVVLCIWVIYFLAGLVTGAVHHG